MKRPRTYQKPVPHPRPVEPDTIPWSAEVVDIPPLEVEIDLYEKFGSVHKEKYELALILPLAGKNYLEDLAQLKEDVSYRFLNYYAGTLLALEDLASGDTDFHVEVINSSIRDNDPERIISRLNHLSLDLIIGPYERELLKEVALYGRRKDITVISPWQSSSKLTTLNPNYIQLKPDITEFYHAMVDHVDQHFKPEEVYLIGRQSNRQEMSRLNYLQEYHLRDAKGYSERDEYQLFHVEEDSLSLGETAFDSLFFEQDKRRVVVILPNWSYRDEQFIYDCVRKLNAEKGEHEVVLYGMPILRESDKIGFNLYKNLNMRLAMDAYLEKDNPEVKKFRKRFYETYKALPTDDALEGYDVMLFLGRNLVRHGSKFQYFLEGSYQEFVHTTYEINPQFSEDRIREEMWDVPDYFENTHVEIRAYDYNKFIKLD